MITPLQDRVVVKPLVKEEITRGGIHIPDSAKKKPSEGIVVAVGPGKEKPLTIIADDRVLFNKYSGTEVEIDGEYYIIMREDDILGIL